MMSTKEEETLRFFQYVEDSGLRAYNGLVSQSLDHARNERNRIYLQEKNDKKRKQEEAKKRTGEEVVTEGKHLRMSSLTMPAPPERVAVPPYLAGGPGFAVRSQSLHSVGGGDEEVGSPTSRKQPPPKPRRDPATKLSISSETVDHSPTLVCRGCRANPDSCDAPQGCGEDCKRVPPPKPRRNPNTQLSTSFDESYIRKHSGSKGHSPSSERERNPSPPSDGSPSHHSDYDEPVYIEMGASVGGGGHTEAPRSEDDEPDESVYEEMKYPLLDDMDYRWDPPGCRSACPTPAPLDPEPLSRCSTPRNIPLCDIPAPFPNLLSHRPPLLVFPPAPAQCSPNSDESPLTPLDALAKLPMMDSPGPFSKSPTSSSSSEPPSAHLRRELTATPTLTVSGRSSAPPLPCTLYKSSASSAHGYQRSHSACPSPVSMGRCLTPLSLMRTPAFDASTPFPGGMPRSASATPHGKGSPPQDCASGGRLHGSMQNVSTGRSRTPTSPLDELTNLFTAGRNMMKKNASGRKSKEPGENESSKNKPHGESKRDGKERHSHSKESKREGKERGKESSSHRRDAKDRGCSSVEPPPVKRDTKERGCSSVEPLLVRRDSKDRSTTEPPPVRRDSKGRSCSNAERMPRRDSKDKSVYGTEPIQCLDSKNSPLNGVESRHDSKERPGHQNPPELLPRQDSKDRTRSATDSRHDSRERTDPPPELLPRQSNNSRDSPRTGLECRRDSKDRDRVCYSPESRHEVKERSHNGVEPSAQPDIKESARNGLEARRDSKDRSCNGSELPPRRDSYGKSGCGADPRHDNKDRLGHSSEALVRRDSRDKGTFSVEQSKAQEKNGVPGQHSSTATPTRHGRHAGSPPLVLGSGSTELKPALQKYCRSSSAPVTPSPLGTPQRQAPEVQVPQMPWMCGDSTMLEQIERKRTLCMEIRSRQRPTEKTPPERNPPERNPPDRNPPDRNLCKQESMPALPTYGKSNVAKKIRPPPYPTQTTVFWDTAI